MGGGRLEDTPVQCVYTCTSYIIGTVNVLTSREWFLHFGLKLGFCHFGFWFLGKPEPILSTICYEGEVKKNII